MTTSATSMTESRETSNETAQGIGTGIQDLKTPKEEPIAVNETSGSPQASSAEPSGNQQQSTKQHTKPESSPNTFQSSPSSLQGKESQPASDAFAIPASMPKPQEEWIGALDTSSASPSFTDKLTAIKPKPVATHLEHLSASYLASMGIPHPQSLPSPGPSPLDSAPSTGGVHPSPLPFFGHPSASEMMDQAAASSNQGIPSGSPPFYYGDMSSMFASDPNFFHYFALSQQMAFNSHQQQSNNQQQHHHQQQNSTPGQTRSNSPAPQGLPFLAMPPFLYRGSPMGLGGLPNAAALLSQPRSPPNTPYLNEHPDLPPFHSLHQGQTVSMPQVGGENHSNPDGKQGMLPRRHTAAALYGNPMQSQQLNSQNSVINKSSRSNSLPTINNVPTANNLSPAEKLAMEKERPFKCTYPGCDARFPRMYNLKSHMLCHTGN